MDENIFTLGLTYSSSYDVEKNGKEVATSKKASFLSDVSTFYHLLVGCRPVDTSVT